MVGERGEEDEDPGGGEESSAGDEVARGGAGDAVGVRVGVVSMLQEKDQSPTEKNTGKRYRQLKTVLKHCSRFLPEAEICPSSESSNLALKFLD